MAHVVYNVFEIAQCLFVRVDMVSSNYARSPGAEYSKYNMHMLDTTVRPVHTVMNSNSPHLWYERLLLQSPTKLVNGGVNNG